MTSLTENRALFRGLMFTEMLMLICAMEIFPEINLFLEMHIFPSVEVILFLNSFELFLIEYNS